MKQLKLFLTLLIIVAMAVSCKKDEKNDKADAILVTKIITTDADGQKTTALYEYSGTKIKTITETSDEGTTVYTYTYTGDDISKIVQRNEDGLVKSQSFVHAGGKLLIWTENSETDADVCTDCETLVTAMVSYNTDGSQTVKYYVKGSDVVQKQVKVTQTSNPNLTNTIYEVGSDGLTKLFINSTYYIDNPHKNITGWTKLQRLNPLQYSAFNPVAYLETNGSTEDGFLVEYDILSGFPSVETARSVANNNIVVYKKEYFYNKSI